jgi:hypothetical protein
MGKLMRDLIAAGRSPKEVGNTMQTIISFTDSLDDEGYADTPLRRLKSLENVGLADIIGDPLDLGPANRWPGCRIELSDVEVPSLNIASWYDVFQQYTLDGFSGSRTQGRGDARHSRLLVGPWTHGKLVAPPGTMVGEHNFGTAASGAMIDLTAIHLRWFDRWLKNTDNGIEKESPVRLFVTGKDGWADFPDWPPEAKEERLYLGPNSILGFSIPDIGGSSTSYTYDPTDPALTLGGNTLLALPGIKDQRPLSARPDVLTFVGNQVNQPLRVAGRIMADLWISSSAPDTDFVVRLIDQHPDGYMQNLCDGIIRARYRHSLAEPAWLKPGEIYELKVDLWSIAHVFKPGHHIAVQVTSSSFPRWDRNWNTTEDPGAATTGQSARNTIWHDSSHPSCIMLPVGGE